MAKRKLAKYAFIKITLLIEFKYSTNNYYKTKFYTKNFIMKKNELANFFNAASVRLENMAKSTELIKVAPFAAVAVAPFDLGLSACFAGAAAALGGGSVVTGAAARVAGHRGRDIQPPEA